MFTFEFEERYNFLVRRYSVVCIIESILWSVKKTLFLKASSKNSEKEETERFFEKRLEEF
jgi:hypothetical protein